MTDVIERLRDSGEEVALVAAGISGEGWTASPGEGQWSALEIVEHLILVEQTVMWLLRRAMDAPLAEGRCDFLTDEEVWGRLAGDSVKPAVAPGRAEFVRA